MITKVKPVYYCEYCGKRYLSKGHMNKHERGCTARPDRKCGLCGNGDDVQTEPFAQYLEPAPSGIEAEWLPIPEHPIRQVIEGRYDDFIEAVGSSVEYCPACMLAIIRQLHITRIPWEYRDAKREWWADVNERNFEQENHSWYE